MVKQIIESQGFFVGGEFFNLEKYYIGTEGNLRFLPFYRLQPIFSGCKTFIFHGFGVQG